MVKKIAAALPAAPNFQAPGGTFLVYSDAADGFFEAGNHLAASLASAALATKVAGAGDVVLMLDSSWEFHDRTDTFFVKPDYVAPRLLRPSMIWSRSKFLLLQSSYSAHFL